VERRSSKKIKQKPTLFDSDAGRYVVGCLGLIAIGLIIYGAFTERWHGRGGPDRCPNDGRVAEWTTRRADGLCDYGHSNFRSASHTWRGRCPDGMRPLGADEEKVVRPAIVDDRTSLRPR
jgi:hypothetical protein